MQDVQESQLKVRGPISADGETRVPSGTVNVATVEHPVRARLGNWPYDHTIAHLVLLDHNMVPGASDVSKWVEMAAQRGATTLRTGALFPTSIHAFQQAGFVPIDTLTLLECELSGPLPMKLSRRSMRTRTTSLRSTPVRRLRFTDLPAAAIIDRRAFDPPWSNDAETLADICRATPHYRSRAISEGGRLSAFSISGRAATCGYIQRVAVDPSQRRCGLGRMLVIDALEWMFRRNVRRVMVNTAADNHAAISLYRSLGFETRPERLVILELSIGDRES